MDFERRFFLGSPPNLPAPIPWTGQHTVYDRDFTDGCATKLNKSQFLSVLDEDQKSRSKFSFSASGSLWSALNKITKSRSRNQEKCINPELTSAHTPSIRRSISNINLSENDIQSNELNKRSQGSLELPEKYATIKRSSGSLSDIVHYGESDVQSLKTEESRPRCTTSAKYIEIPVIGERPRPIGAESLDNDFEGTKLKSCSPCVIIEHQTKHSHMSNDMAKSDFEPPRPPPRKKKYEKSKYEYAKANDNPKPTTSTKQDLSKEIKITVNSVPVKPERKRRNKKVIENENQNGDDFNKDELYLTELRSKLSRCIINKDSSTDPCSHINNNNSSLEADIKSKHFCQQIRESTVKKSQNKSGTHSPACDQNNACNISNVYANKSKCKVPPPPPLPCHKPPKISTTEKNACPGKTENWFKYQNNNGEKLDKIEIHTITGDPTSCNTKNGRSRSRNPGLLVNNNNNVRSRSPRACSEPEFAQPLLCNSHLSKSANRLNDLQISSATIDRNRNKICKSNIDRHQHNGRKLLDKPVPPIRKSSCQNYQASSCLSKTLTENRPKPIHENHHQCSNNQKINQNSTSDSYRPPIPTRKPRLVK